MNFLLAAVYITAGTVGLLTVFVKYREMKNGR